MKLNIFSRLLIPPKMDLFLSKNSSLSSTIGISVISTIKELKWLLISRKSSSTIISLWSRFSKTLTRINKELLIQLSSISWSKLLLRKWRTMKLIQFLKNSIWMVTAKSHLRNFTDKCPMVSRIRIVNTILPRKKQKSSSKNLSESFKVTISISDKSSPTSTRAKMASLVLKNSTSSCLLSTKTFLLRKQRPYLPSSTQMVVLKSLLKNFLQR